MAWFIGQLALLLLLAFGLGLLLGYLIWIFGWRKSVTSATTAATDTRAALATRTSELEDVRAELAAAQDELADVRARLADEESARAEAEVRRLAAESRPPSTVPEPGEQSPDVGADARDGRPSLPEDVDARAHALVAGITEPDEPDDLTRVEGIGPKMARALDAAGIRTFRTLAVTGAAELRAAIEAAGMRFAPSLPTWARQAAYLAVDDIDGLRDYTQHLVAGREPTPLRRR